MANVKTFRDLVAWRKAMELVKAVYRQSASIPEQERFGLTMQMRRSAVSIPSNIAEGFGRESRSDLLRFLRVARGSLNELATQVEIAASLNMLPSDQSLQEQMAEVDRVLQGLIRSLGKPRNGD